MENLAPYFWVALMILFCAVEGATVQLVTIWFAAGALAAGLVQLCHGAFWLQVVVFLVVSAGLLALLRPLVRKHLNPKKMPTNVDSIIGTRGVVTVDIDNITAQGQVKLGALEWSARSATDSPIPAGTVVQVDRIEGVKAYVSPAAVPASK